MMPFIDFDNDFLDTEALLFLSSASGTAVEDTATGNPLTFATNIAKPLKSLLIPFTPKQEGSGDPSPTNIRNIVPWNGLMVFGGGKNLLNPVADDWLVRENTYRYINGVVPEGATARFTLEVKDSTVDISGCYLGFVLNDLAESSPTGYKWVIEGGTVKTDMSNLSTGGSQVGQRCSNVFIYPATAETFQKLFSRFNVMVEVGSTATAYEPYKPITETDISFPSPVYGGTLDVVSGVLTVEWIAHTFDGTETFLKNGTFTGGVRFLSSAMTGLSQTIAYCDKMSVITGAITTITKLSVKIGAPPYQLEMYVPDDSIVEGEATKDDFTRWLSENNVTVVAKLIAPQEIQLTPKQITAIVGNNTIWSDADGSMTAVYLKKP